VQLAYEGAVAQMKTIATPRRRRPVAADAAGTSTWFRREHRQGTRYRDRENDARAPADYEQLITVTLSLKTIALVSVTRLCRGRPRIVTIKGIPHDAEFVPR